MAYLSDAERERRSNERDARQAQRMQEMNNVRANDSTGAAIGLGLRQLPGFLKDYAMHYIDASNNSGFARGYSGFKRGITGNAYQSPEAAQAAEQQQETGGGTVQAAEQTERQQATAPAAPAPATNPQPAATGSTTETRQIGGVEANVTTNPNNRVTKVASGDPNSPGPYGRVELVDPNAKARGLPTAEQLAEYQNQQAAMRRYGNIMRPNGESDRDFNANSQVVVTPGRGRATNNPGYTFAGSAGDAARFFQPVGRPGGYNPYRQSFRTLFDEQMDARRAARAQPEKPQMDMTLPGNSRRAKYHEQMQAYNNELNQGYGLDAKQMENALQRQRLAQEYGISMAQLGNDTLRTRSALLRDAAAIRQGQTQARQEAKEPKVYSFTREDAMGGKTPGFGILTPNGMMELPSVRQDGQAGGQDADIKRYVPDEGQLKDMEKRIPKEWLPRYEAAKKNGTTHEFWIQLGRMREYLDQ